MTGYTKHSTTTKFHYIWHNDRLHQTQHNNKVPLHRTYWPATPNTAQQQSSTTSYILTGYTKHSTTTKCHYILHTDRLHQTQHNNKVPLHRTYWPATPNTAQQQSSTTSYILTGYTKHSTTTKCHYILHTDRLHQTQHNSKVPLHRTYWPATPNTAQQQSSTTSYILTGYTKHSTTTKFQYIVHNDRLHQTQHNNKVPLHRTYWPATPNTAQQQSATTSYILTGYTKHCTTTKCHYIVHTDRLHQTQHNSKVPVYRTYWPATPNTTQQQSATTSDIMTGYTKHSTTTKFHYIVHTDRLHQTQHNNKVPLHRTYWPATPNTAQQQSSTTSYILTGYTKHSTTTKCHYILHTDRLHQTQHNSKVPLHRAYWPATPNTAQQQSSTTAYILTGYTKHSTTTKFQYIVHNDRLHQTQHNNKVPLHRTYWPATPNTAQQQSATTSYILTGYTKHSTTTKCHYIIHTDRLHQTQHNSKVPVHRTYWPATPNTTQQQSATTSDIMTGYTKHSTTTKCHYIVHTDRLHQTQHNNKVPVHLTYRPATPNTAQQQSSTTSDIMTGYTKHSTTTKFHYIVHTDRLHQTQHNNKVPLHLTYWPATPNTAQQQSATTSYILTGYTKHSTTTKCHYIVNTDRSHQTQHNNKVPLHLTYWPATQNTAQQQSATTLYILTGYTKHSTTTKFHYIVHTDRLHQTQHNNKVPVHRT